MRSSVAHRAGGYALLAAGASVQAEGRHQPGADVASRDAEPDAGRAGGTGTTNSVASAGAAGGERRAAAFEGGSSMEPDE